MSTYCYKCGISQSYYTRYNMGHLSCCYHNDVKNGICGRCGLSTRKHMYCYHQWVGPLDRINYNISYYIQRVLLCIRN